jgi:predicted small secreted protein
MSRPAPTRENRVLSREIKGLPMKKIFVLALVAFVLAGCNTISGVGKDVQKVGQVITGAGGK